MFGKKLPALVVTQGANAGKSIPLKKSEIRIGSQDDCQLKVAGRYISPLHAVLRNEGPGRGSASTWTLENHSINGTLVNGVSVKSAPLVHGDRIVIGGALELEFSDSANAPAVTSSSPAEQTEADLTEDGAAAEVAVSAEKKGKGRRTTLIAALGLYGVALAVLAVFLSLYEGSGAEQGPLDMQRLDKVLAATRYELAQSAGFADTEQASCALTSRHPGFVRAQAAAQGRKSGVSPLRAEDLERLMGKLEAAFHAAWREEMQGRYQAAASHYTEVFELLPGIRFCASRFAAERIRKLNDD